MRRADIGVIGEEHVARTDARIVLILLEDVLSRLDAGHRVAGDGAADDHPLALGREQRDVAVVGLGHARRDPKRFS